MPVPVSAMAKGELEALLVTVAVPERVPTLAGAKTTLKLVDWLAASVSGSVVPVEVNPVPVTLTLEMVTLEFPVLVRVTVWVELVPVVTLPKLSDVEEAESWRTGATLVPDNGITNGELGELFVSDKLA